MIASSATTQPVFIHLNAYFKNVTLVLIMSQFKTQHRSCWLSDSRRSVQIQYCFCCLWD